MNVIVIGIIVLVVLYGLHQLWRSSKDGPQNDPNVTYGDETEFFEPEEEDDV